jgi:hypothetical protein
MTEADTCRKFVIPKLVDAGWHDAWHWSGRLEQQAAEEAEVLAQN